MKLSSKSALLLTFGLGIMSIGLRAAPVPASDIAYVEPAEASNATHPVTSSESSENEPWWLQPGKFSEIHAVHVARREEDLPYWLRPGNFSELHQDHQAQIARRSTKDVSGVSTGLASLVGGSVITIATAIIDGIKQDKLDRSEFTQRVVAGLHDQDPSNNYVIIHTSHEMNWDGEQNKDWAHSHQEFDVKVGGTIGYEVYTGHAGHLKIKGDGGYLNWAYYGNAEKLGAKEYNFKA